MEPQSSLVAVDNEPTPDEAVEEKGNISTAHIVARQIDMTPAEVQEVEKCLRLRAFLLCVYASVWGMGGHLVGEASRVMCSAYVRQVRRCSFCSPRCLRVDMDASMWMDMNKEMCSQPRSKHSQRKIGVLLCLLC